MRRSGMSRKASKRNFKKGTATMGANLTMKPLRGGWRF